MRLRVARLHRVIDLLRTDEKTHEARLATLQRAETENRAKLSRLIVYLSEPCRALGLAHQARRNMCNLISDGDALAAEIHAERARLVAVRRKIEGARHLASRFQNALLAQEERRLLEEIAPRVTKGSRKPGA
jgi:hypothetical protein